MTITDNIDHQEDEFATDNRSSDLPSKWLWTTLEDICSQPQYGWTTKATSDGNLRLLRTTDITSGRIDWESVPYCTDEPAEPEKYLLKDGDIVISRAGSVGFSYLVRNPQDAVFASYLIRFKLKHVDERYISYFLQSPRYWRTISESKLGIAVQNVNATKLKQIRIPIAPLPEQRRIVAAIETQFTRLDAAVAALERVQANLKRYRASVLKAACEGRLVPTEADLARQEGRDYEPASVLLERILAERRARWEADEWEKHITKAQKKAAQAKRKAAGLPARISDLEPHEWQDLPEADSARYLPKNDKWKEKYQPPEPPDTSDLPDLPEGWVWVSVENLFDMTSGNAFKKSEYSEHGVPLLQIANVSFGRIIWYAKAYLPVEYLTRYPHLALKEDDVLMALNRPLLDGRLKIGVMKKTDAPAILYQRVGRFDFYLSDISRYIFMFCQSPSFVSVLEKMLQGVDQPFITKTRLMRVFVPLPPLAKQQLIVAEVERLLSIADQMEKTVEADLPRANRLRQSILKRAFEGNLVPQDPNDEPAAALLARIQAQRNGEPLQITLL